jgi:hypothetical protein
MYRFRPPVVHSLFFNVKYRVERGSLLFDTNQDKEPLHGPHRNL